MRCSSSSRGGGQRGPEDLLHRRVEQVRVGGQGGALVGVGEQPEHTPVDRGHGGLVAGEEQPRTEHGRLVRAHRRALVRGGEQQAQHVVGGLRALGLDQPAHVLPQGEQPELGAVGVDEVGRVVGPAAEVVAVGVGHPEQLGDDERGQREGHGLVQVDRRGPGEHRVQQLVDDRLDPRAQRGHPPGGEHRREQSAHPHPIGVLGNRVVAGRAAEDRRAGHARGVRGVRVRAAETLIGEQRLDVVVAGDQPRRIAGESGHAADTGVGGGHAVSPERGRDRGYAAGGPGVRARAERAVASLRGEGAERGTAVAFDLAVGSRRSGPTDSRRREQRGRRRAPPPDMDQLAAW